MIFTTFEEEYFWVLSPSIVHGSRCNNRLIAKLVSIFADVEERGEEESLALMQVTSWA
jgi:hypothetical protein